MSFSDKADVVCRRRPTGTQAIDALGQLQAENGTALGDAITRSLDLGLASLDGQAKAKVKDANGQSPLVILLLSDGASTTGDATPLEAAQQAKKAGVPVYTVALGTANGTIEGPDGYGGTRRSASRPTPRR